MSISRRKFITDSAAVTTALSLLSSESHSADAASLPESEAVESTPVPPLPGPYEPNWDSLKQYQCPDWFRDAKFGIWAHWSPQCLPEQGDWYALHMYEEGSDDYNYHCAHYGHPSQFGFKDIDHIWNVDAWEPAKMIALYKAAGAKYFVSLANHHDGFDCFDSKYQPWNSINIGPKRDLVGTWAKEARKAGLHFGVTCHGSRTWAWLEVSRNADTKGPLAGVPYDGSVTMADGKGKWWDGKFDPQDLYAQNHKRMGGDFNFWHADPGGELPSKPYCEKFYNRATDIIDKYHPDLLYFDDQVLPLYQISDIGLRIAAYHYNASLLNHHGRMEVVLNGKGLSDDQMRCMIQDIERGQSDVIRPEPWQTDTCIGDWHYKRSLYENHQYKTPDYVIKTLMDIVSKNGNLLLNIPVRGDGSLDPDEVAFLQAMAAWMSVNEEAIFKTRPWKVYGEGPVKVGGGSFSEVTHPFTAEDFRFTTKGNVLYATALAWPDDGTLTVRTLAATATGLVGQVKNVTLLGCPDKLTWSRTADGLVVSMPTQKPCDHAYALKIEGLDLAASQIASA